VAPSTARRPSADSRAPSVDPQEVAQFSALAAEWWNPDGQFRPLHRLNPVRLAYIRDTLIAHFHRKAAGTRPLAGLRVLDIGCGGGLIAEPLARLGAAVTGVDASEENVGVARAHAAEMGLAIDYRAAAAEDLAKGGEPFDVVLCLEIVEHVADLDGFLAAAARLVRPGGVLIAATLNRTPQSYLFAIVGAEYVLRWLPRGTHNWEKFVRPSELAARLRQGGLAVRDLSGVVYSPLSGAWRIGRDLGVNYICCAVRPA
jgi:2-polyprenyl-6-hydroxyphenyl methylase / 3-demethylubiquinone-9 3-methyltransferase